MSAMPRRAFLGQLARLPLIGGSVELIDAPRAVAEPVTADLLQSYKTWLHFEHRYLAWEMAERPDLAAFYGGTVEQRFDAIAHSTRLIDVGDAARFHIRGEMPSPSSRAALVLSAAGCGW